MQSVVLCYSIPQIPTDLPRGHGVQAGVAGWAEAFALVGTCPFTWLQFLGAGTLPYLRCGHPRCSIPAHSLIMTPNQHASVTKRRWGSESMFWGRKMQIVVFQRQVIPLEQLQEKRKKNWLQVNHRFGVLRHTAATSCTLTISVFCFLPCIQWLANYIDQLTEGEMFKSATGFFYTCGEIMTSRA